ncbi:hypothetical protein, partial [uncultured Flavonifractor sp.]|uniref:hypothetical protein n=1 Tax=uncultured Flavonifractor sp. TaxID=1193534 RepID=UPI0026135052
ISTISITLRSIFPRSSILLTTSSILPHLNEKAQLLLDFFDRLGLFRQAEACIPRDTGFLSVRSDAC